MPSTAFFIGAHLGTMRALQAIRVFAAVAVPVLLLVACGADGLPVIPDPPDAGSDASPSTNPDAADDASSSDSDSSTAPDAGNDGASSSCAPALTAPVHGTVSATTGASGDVRTYACDAGYALTGSATTTCQPNGSWSGTAPTCVPTSCGTIPAAPSHGAVTAPSPGSGVTGDTVSYACNAGYTLTGAASATCEASGSWTAPPTCAANSCAVAPSAPTHGTVSAPSPGNGMTGDTVTYTCDAGYLLTGSTSATCTPAGTWSAAPSCAAQPCSPALTAPTHGSVSKTTGTTGATRTYTCSAGYTLTGSATTTCQANHAWSNPAPICAASSCGAVPTAPSNGAVTAPSPGAGVTDDTVSYTCNAGYTRTGPAIATCQASGSWSAAPVCTANSCGAAPSAPAHGTVTAPSPGAGVTGDSVMYACNAGYSLSGGSTATCQASGAWTAPASCIADACTPDLTAPAHGSVSATTGATGDTRTFGCSAGYTLSGASTTTCQATHAWSNPTPTCAPNSCGALPSAPTNGSVSAPSPGAGVTGDTVSFTCLSSYRLQGTATATCQTSGAWTASPMCVLDTVPSAPTGLTLTPGAAQMALSWTAPASNGGNTIDAYDVYVDGTFKVRIVGATSTIVSGINTCNYPADTCTKSYTFAVYAHNAQGFSGPVSGSGKPKTSYVADNIANIWSKAYGAGTCTGCHATNVQTPDLVAGAPAGYASSKAEGALIYQCPVNDPACGPFHTGLSLFGTSSPEYRALVQWVADGNPQ
jgi:hypothetical protein